MKKRIFLIALAAFCFLIPAFALPGFTPYVPDLAGEWVFYKDNTFERESYIGLLSYDEATYQMKYYAPRSKETMEGEKEIAILFSIDPESGYLDMNGERIITDVDPNSNDVDILNYLHDLLYEFSSRRIKIDDLTDKEYSVSQEYEQFGGKVIFTFDSVIPLFNIKSIKGIDGTVLLNCCTFGRILSAEDKTFENFKGIEKGKPYHAPGKDKSKAKSKKFTTEDNQTITLDTSWTQAMDNAWTYGNEAFLTIATIPTYYEDKNVNNTFILRRVLESVDGSYTNFEDIEILRDTKTNTYKITSKIYQPENNQIIYAIKQIVSNSGKNTNSYLSLSVYEDSYLEKSNYYSKILKTLKTN